MMSIFGAYDIRGTYPEDLDRDLAFRIAHEYMNLLDAESVFVSRDIRTASREIQEPIIEGCLSTGAHVVDGGITTTPMNYFGVGTFDLDAGIMITASHNPPGYTGMKLSREKGAPVSGDTGLGELAERVQSRTESPPADPAKGSRETVDLIPEYRPFLQSQLTCDPTGLQVAVDGACGAMAHVFDPLLGDLPVQWELLCMQPDESFPEHPPDPMKPENTMDLRDRIQASNCDFGAAFDGDGDRVFFLDREGNRISPDLILAILSGDLLEQYNEEAIVYDLRSSRVVPEVIEKKGGTPIREQVGHAFIRQTMREKNALFGGELTGHYYYRDHYYADNALLTLIRIINRIVESGQPLHELVNPYNRYHRSEEINFTLSNPGECIERLADIYDHHARDRLDGLSVSADRWWFNLRKSNTEPLIRLNMEADTEALLEEKRDEIRNHINRIGE